MSLPSKPVNIKSPRLRPSEPPDGPFGSGVGAGAGLPGSYGITSGAGGGGTPLSGTPDLRLLRQQYAGTPPLPNIPLRGTPMGTPNNPMRGTPMGTPNNPMRGTPMGTPIPVRGTPMGTPIPMRGTPMGTPIPVRGTPMGTPIPVRGTPMGTPHRTGSPAQGGFAQTPVLSSTPRSIAGAMGMGMGMGVGVGGISAARRPDTPLQTDTPPPIDIDDLPDEEKARVLRRHLVSKNERAMKSKSNPSSEPGSEPGSSRHSLAGGSHHPAREDTEPFPVPYDAHGADITHDIYKWHSDQQRQTRPRAASYAGIEAPADPAFEHIHEPGGFRRNYVLLRANEQGEEEPQILSNFIDFLYIFGHFAGEDLDEDEEDEEDKEDDEEAAIASSSRIVDVDAGLSPTDAAERTPLLRSSTMKTSRSRSRRRRGSVSHGDATVTQAVLMLLKAFVGTGVLFLGKAFYNGGLLFSAITLGFICLISLYSFLLLVEAKFVVPGSFGDIGGTLYGPWMRYMILSSIAISQLGFVSAYTIFVAQNLQAFVMAITHCINLISVQYFILMQLVIFLPLALIRNLAKLSTTALIADAFILVGLVYIFGSEVGVIAKEGFAEVHMFNKKDFPLFIGTAVFSFEGIGLVIPITDSMREPRKFPMVLTWVMMFLLVLFGGGGALSYLTFGADVQTVVIVNLDSEKKFTQAVQFLYSIAILLSVPLQLFPAVRIMENGLFTRSGKADTRVKWLKNIFRFFIVMVCTGISWAGAADLDKFVSFVGSFACVPLCYIYPAMLHYKACAHTRRQKIQDILLMIFGAIAAVYTTAQTIRLMMEPDSSGPPRLGNCPPPPPDF